MVGKVVTLNSLTIVLTAIKRTWFDTTVAEKVYKGSHMLVYEATAAIFGRNSRMTEGYLPESRFVEFTLRPTNVLLFPSY